MKKPWSSRERMLAAINLQEPDHVPLWNLWTEHTRTEYAWDDGSGRGGTWADQIERAEALLARGLDDTLMLWTAADRRPLFEAALARAGVTTRVRKETRPSQPYPILMKEWHTPKGTLRQICKQTKDWPHGDDIPLYSNWAMARSIEYLVKGPEDLEKLAYLFPPLGADEIALFREEAKRVKSAARRLNVMLEGGWISGSDALLLLCGVTPLLTAAVDDPEYVAAALKLLHDWQRPQVEMLLEEGVDTVVYDAWYDTTRFWSPRLYRQLLKPFIKEMIDLTHQGGAKFSYILTSGIMPLLDDFVEMGIDILWGVDPVQGDADLPVVKQKLGGKVCIWGGMNSVLTLQHGSRQEIRDAVTEAIRILAPGGGFVLFPVDQIFAYTPWENFEIMVERWREIASYPIRL